MAATGVGMVTAALAAAPPPNATHLAFTQVPRQTNAVATPGLASTMLADRYRLGSRVMIARWPSIDATLHSVGEGFQLAADPAFHHDGRRLLFAALPERGTALQIFETMIGESAVDQLTSGIDDCITPAYLPHDAIVFATTRTGEYEEHGDMRSLSLYEWAEGMPAPARLSFNPSSEFGPTVLPDGRVAFSSWQHVGNHFWPRGTIALMLINSDGTGLFPLTGNHREPWLKRGVTPYGEDRVAFIAATPDSMFGAGALLACSLNDQFAPCRSIVADDRYLIEGAAPLPDGRAVVSARPRDDADATFGLYVLRDDGTLELLFDDPDFHEIAPAVGHARARDELRSSTVVPGTPHGYVVVLDCTETDRVAGEAFQADDVDRVRVIEGLPLRIDERDPAFRSMAGREDEPLAHAAGATGHIPGRILGEVPPASDGSLYLKVPADRPLRLQLVDRDGFTIMNQRAWFWVRPNERRVCIGCHEDRELAPPNRTAEATRKPPADLTDPDGWRTVTFRHDVAPIVEERCARPGCHVPPRPMAGMNLADDRPYAGDAPLAETYGRAYANLLARQPGKPFGVGGRRVHPGDSRGSPLLWMLHGRRLADQYRPSPFERPLLDPHPDEPLSPDQLQLIRTWIDLGALYDIPDAASTMAAARLTRRTPETATHEEP